MKLNSSGVKRLHCLREPDTFPKDAGDFCMHHPAWPEFEAGAGGEAISDFYDDEAE